MAYRAFLQHWSDEHGNPAYNAVIEQIDAIGPISNRLSYRGAPEGGLYEGLFDDVGAAGSAIAWAAVAALARK